MDFGQEHGTCVACGEVAEGKPLYKKLGNLEIKVYDALIKMQLLSLPELEKEDLYICWDCDETIAEEYTSFVETEQKKKCDEKKRKEQDVIRTQKLNKKLKQAFKKVHKESLISKGDIPPISKYKEKEQRKMANRYYASNCVLCRNNFKSSKTGYLRFNVKKMVDDHCCVYEALQKLGTDLNLDPNIQLRRYICCQCYNKVRRNYKGILKCSDINPANNHIPPYINGNPQGSVDNIGSAIKRATFDEHAAEIAKLIPPELADMYKVIGKDADKRDKTPLKDVDVLHDLSMTESESDSSEGSDKAIKTCINKENHLQKKDKNETLVPKKSSHKIPHFFGRCVHCGVQYKDRSKSFWFSTQEKLPSNPKVTIALASMKLQTKLNKTKTYVKCKKYICKPCCNQFCTAYESKFPKESKSSNSNHINGIVSARNKYKPRPLSIKNKLGIQSLQNNTDTVATTMKNLKLSHSPITTNKRKKLPKHIATKNPDVRKDIHLLHIINNSKHLRYNGREVYLNSVDVNLLDIADPLQFFPGPTIYIERLDNIYLYSNFMRCVRNKFDGKCILCLSNMKTHTCRWLEDPVDPPHIMVPLRWARLSLGPADDHANLAINDGKVCSNCYNYVKTEFMKFVKNKIGLSMDGGKVSLKHYKVSFDSIAKSVVADSLLPLQSYCEPKSDNTKENDISSQNVSPPKDKSSPKNQRMSDLSREERYPDKLEKEKYKQNDSISHRVSSPDFSEDNSKQSGSSYFSSDDESVNSIISNYSDEVDKYECSKAKNNRTLSVTTSTPKTLFRANGLKSNISPVISINKTGQKRKRDINQSPTKIPEKKRHKFNDIQIDPVEDKPISGNKKRLFEDDQFEEDYFQSSEDTVAPFAQRKKIRTGPTPTTTAEVKPSNDIPNISKTYENIWQILQGISIDCLLSSNDLQPVKPENFTHGFLCALNFLKDEIGASDTDLVHWICKVIPTEFRNLGRKICKDVLLSYLADLYVEKEKVTMENINEKLPVNFYLPLKVKTKAESCLENPLNADGHQKELGFWQDYLCHVNMDKLIDGIAEKVCHDDFNSGLIYALWRTNELFGGNETELLSWMKQSAPEDLSTRCFQTLASNAKNCHRFISENSSCLVKLKLPIIKSKDDLQQIVFVDNVPTIYPISRLNANSPEKPMEVTKNKISVATNLFPETITEAESVDTQQTEICDHSINTEIESKGYASEYNSALVKVNKNDKAVTLASTSKGCPINIDGSMQLIPVVQPSGIVTLVPCNIPLSSMSTPIIQNNPTKYQIPPVINQPFPCTNVSQLFSSGAMPFTINNTIDLNKRIEELERKLKEAEKINLEIKKGLPN